MSDELTMISIKDKAHELKTTRFINGRNFFRTIGCERFVTNFDYEETKKIWLIATPNGWMDRWAFLVWTFFFSVYYKNTLNELPRSFAEKAGVMICDGHSSRENPLALTILKNAGPKVIILTAHTTHVMQLFVVGLASPLKSRFTQIFHSMLKKQRELC